MSRGVEGVSYMDECQGGDSGGWLDCQDMKARIA